MGESKEESRIEKMIRGLLKLPENRRCINCRSLGPQYVCTTFWTFVCTNCSGVHREFNHRVKSISMAKFTSEEVSALQASGNERARQIYFKTWDPHRNFFPDNSNIHKLRGFIKHVYVERRYTGETHPALVPRLRDIDNEEPRERRGGDLSGKPSFHGRNFERYGSLDRYAKYSFKDVRSSGYERENTPRYSGFRSSSCHFEGTGGHYQVDGARIAGRSATDMFTTKDIKPRAKSPDADSPPPLHHLREILGENFSPLRVGDQRQSSLSERRNSHNGANDALVGLISGHAMFKQFISGSGQGRVGVHSKPSSRYIDSPTHDQEGHAQMSGDPARNLHRRSTSAHSQLVWLGLGDLVQSIVQSSNQTSENNAEMKHKSGSVASLVNFANFPPPEACMEQGEATHVNNNGGNSASSQPSQVEETALNTPAKNTVEYLLFELSSSLETPSNNHSGVSAIEEAKEPPSPQQPQEHSIVPILDVATPSTQQPHSTVPLPDGATPRIHRHSVVSVLDVSTSVPQTSCSNGAVYNQSEEVSIVPSAVVPIQERNSAPKVQPSMTEARSSERTELPADLFSSFDPRRPLCWQTSPSHGMRFSLQYHPTSMQIPSFPGLTKSRNPFDTDDNTTQHCSANTMHIACIKMNRAIDPGPKDTSEALTSFLNAAGAYMGQAVYSNMPVTRY
ncbi:hypothetical protein Cgig2_013201 [Carnegiea gigantea]|uniref:Arf-GAP domain-containing protein n=1 Tax=Carnegiea gigantea TaxID=171969 RepID=A0A9Q1KNI4_9CARY|nr:hypothetical protein Cgig2_013201 [Carnegiea gigantea]